MGQDAVDLCRSPKPNPILNGEGGLFWQRIISVLRQQLQNIFCAFNADVGAKGVRAENKPAAAARFQQVQDVLANFSPVTAREDIRQIFPVVID